MAFSPPEYCRLFAQKKAYQGGRGGSRAPQDPPSYAPEKGQEICTYYCVLLLHVFKVVSYFYLKHIKTLQCFLQVNIS